MRNCETGSTEDGLPLALDRKVGLSRLSVGIERFWPDIALLGVICALFLSLSWLGLFSFTPRPLRIAAGIVFAGATLYTLWRIAQWRIPNRAAGALRLDLSDPVLHRPVSALNDRAAGSDPVASALWDRHRARAVAAADKLRVPPPENLVPRRDPYALRALALVLLAAAGFVAGDERFNRITDAFAWGEPVAPPVPPRFDAWIDPPAYTGRAPVFLSGTVSETGPVYVPVGSVVSIRVTPGDSASMIASLIVG